MNINRVLNYAEKNTNGWLRNLFIRCWKWIQTAR